MNQNIVINQSQTLYVVMASRGEYSDREEWVSAIFDNKASAISAAEEHNKKAKADAAYYRTWIQCNWKFRQDWSKQTGLHGWNADKELIEGKCGVEPNIEAHDFTVIEVPLNIWGQWKEIQNAE